MVFWNERLLPLKIGLDAETTVDDPPAISTPKEVEGASDFDTGGFFDAYLDDIVFYSDNLDEHVQRVELFRDMLRREESPQIPSHAPLGIRTHLST